MPSALRFKSFVESVNAANDNGDVKGQTQVFVRTETEEDAVADVFVMDGNLVIMTKEAMSDLAPAKKKIKAKAKTTG